MGHAVPVIWTILVAAGEGRRFGGPKQLQPLGGRRVIDWAIEPAVRTSHGVVVVAAADQVAVLRDGPGALGADPGGDDGERSGNGESVEGTEIIVTGGGATRSASVRAGIAATPRDAEVIVVHDAARPLATDALFSAVTGAVAAGFDGAVPAVAVTDTIRHVDGGPLDRSQLRAVQTPQAFRADVLRRAHLGRAEATDDATLVEGIGGKVHLVEGDPGNLKITEPGDLGVAEVLLAARLAMPADPGGPDHRSTGARPCGPSRDPAGSEVAGRGGASGASSAALDEVPGTLGTNVPLVGIGFDIHRFSDDPDRALVLGGVRFDGERGLEGHSDADAVAHACCDAILGVTGLGDIGSLFPDDDDRWRGADSIALLAEAAERVRRSGRRIGNIDCTVVTERPKLAPRRAEMQQRLSEAVGAPVTVRGKRAESLGALGRGEGIACWAVAVLA